MAENTKRICMDCGCVIEDGMDFLEGDNGIVCETCMDEWCFCEFCGDIHRDYSFVRAEDTGTFACDYCAGQHFYQCNECEEYFELNYNIHQDDYGNTLCEDCFYDGYTICENCGEIIHYDHAHEYDGYSYCRSCFDEIDKTPGNINSYGYKPYPEFFGGENTGEFTFGMELEAGNGTLSGLSEFCEYADMDEIYLKEDCTIPGYGCEIVTHPMTFSYLNGCFDLESILQSARQNGLTSHDNGDCGLHLHVDKRYFGDDDMTQKFNIAKTIILYERHFDNIVNFSRRQEYKIDKWCNCSSISRRQHDTARSLADKISDKIYEDDRYEAVNLQNENTVEFRVFRGSLLMETVMASIQFTKIIIDFAKSSTIDVCDNATWGDIMATGSEFKELQSYLAKRNLVEEPTSKFRIVNVVNPFTGEVQEMFDVEYSEFEKQAEILADENVSAIDDCPPLVISNTINAGHGNNLAWIAI
jgi:hypothetical protein